MKTPSAIQKEAINHINGPAVLVAGPGSGKTFTIVSRIKNLIQKEHIPPDNILVVTFSKAAAKEMQNRFILESGNREVHFGTFHSLAYFILRSSFKFLPNSLITESEKRNMLATIFRNHGFNDLCNSEFLSGILDQISRQKNSEFYSNLSITSESEDLSNKELEIIISEFNELLTDNGKIDFDDMILLCLKKLKSDEKVLNKYRSIFKFIMVDEFQDINRPQYDLLRLLGEPLNNIFVVGDDDQSIYRFRGSRPEIMKKFREDYPDSLLLILSDNYRSASKIVEFSTSVIKKNLNRYEKDYHSLRTGGNVYFYHLKTRADEEKVVIKIIRNIKKEKYNDTAIIVRTNREVSLYSNLLKGEGLKLNEIKKKTKISDTSVAKDIIGFLNFIYKGRRREDFIGIMNKPQKFIQRKALISECIELDELLKFYQKNIQMQEALKDFWKKIELCQKLNEKMAISLIRKSVGYDIYLKESAKNQEEYTEKLSILNDLEKMFEKYNGESDYLDFLNSYKEECPGNENESISEGIVVMTMHMSKGLEFENVILPDVNEGVIPPKNSGEADIEEERRLLYVAITRAKNNLYILCNTERNRTVSRYIKGLIEQYEVK